MSKVRAAQACIDRFHGRPYAPGKRDCAVLALHVLHHAGRRVLFMKGRKWSTEAGAVKVLRKLGFRNLIEAVDATGLERIAPARAVAGDLVALPCEDGPWGCALTVAVGNGRVIGFQDGIGRILQPHAYVAAWRV